MSATGWFILLGCIIFNVFTTYFFFTEEWLKKENSEETEKKSKIMWIYTMFFWMINIGIAMLLYFYYGQTTVPFVLKRLGLLSILWAVGYIDYKTYKIPNRFIILGLLYRVMIIMIELFTDGEYVLANLMSEGVSAIALVIASLLCSVCIKNSVGFGDIKLFIVMGFLLGFESIWSAIFVSLLVTFFVSLGLLISKKKTRKDSIPFGPLLMIGTYISVILTGM